MIQFFPILAQTQYRNRLKGLRSAFNKTEAETTDIQSIVIFFAILAAVIIVVSVAHRLRQSRGGRAASGHPGRLFNQVMKKLGVAFVDRLMMRFMVGRCDLEQPTVLFFNRKLLDRQAGQWVDSISVKPLQDYCRARLAAVTELAFGADDPPIAPAGSQA